MFVESSDVIYTHEEPARRGPTNLILAAALEPSEDGRRRWEQLWTQRDTDDTAVISCIPFFAGYCLGDTVAFSADYRISGLVASGPEVSFRVWFGEPYNTPNSVRDEVLAEVVRIGGDHEHHGNLLAISAPTHEKGLALSGFLLGLESDGLLVYETAR